MLQYVVAMAVAVTVLISPTPAPAMEGAAESSKVPAWSAPTPRAGELKDPAVSTNAEANPPTLYRLDRAQQDAMKRALFRSIRFLD